MAHNVFVSYKYSDAVHTRETIRAKLGNCGQYYKGEKGFVALQNADSTIKEYLKDMIFNTSVTVVVISPEVKYSEWVDWEIRYSLRQTRRGEILSYRNGIICVIQSSNSWQYKNCDWAKDQNGRYRKDIFPKSIIDNLQTTFSPLYSMLYEVKHRPEKDYCVIVSEHSFLSDPVKYIEEAYNRAHDLSIGVVVNRQVE